jgi:hypothetical protein
MRRGPNAAYAGCFARHSRTAHISGCLLTRFLAASPPTPALQILESSQTLLAVLKREAVSLSKRSAAPL